jgi:lysophospholipase L1-like esterase
MPLTIPSIAGLAFAGASSAAFAPLAVAVVRPVANRTKSTFVNTHLSDGTNTFGVYRSRHRIFPGWDCFGGLRVAFCNRSGDQNGQNAITVSGRIEIPAGSSNWTPFTFSAAGSVTIQPTDNDVFCDALAVTPAGGTYVNIETHVSVASAGMKWPMLDSISLAAANGEGSALSAISDPGAPPNLDTTEFYGPTAIIGLSKAPRAPAVFSDSIGNGAKDTLTGDKIGFLQRIVGDTLPIINFSTSGDTLAAFVAGNSRRLGLADQCGITDAFLAYGTNDTKVLATLQSNYLIATGLMTVRGWNVISCPVLTSTTTSNNWQDATGQTIVANYTLAGIVDQFNTWLQTLPAAGSIDKFLDTRPGWQDAANKILTTGAAFGYTPDGLHPGPFGNQQMAAPFTAAGSLPSTTKTVARSYLAWSGLKVHIAPTLEAVTATVATEPNLAPSGGNLTPGAATTAVTARSAATFFNAPMLRQNRSGTSDSAVLTASSSDVGSTMLQGTNVDYTFLIAFAPDGSGVGFAAGWCSPINGTTTDQAMLVYRSAANTGWRYGRTGDTNLDVNITSPAIVPANKMHVLGVIHSAGKTSIWFDSKTASITNATQAPGNAFDANTQFMAGNSVLSGATPAFSTNGWGGWTGKVVACNNARSVGEMQQAIQDLANEFGILLS